MDARFYNSEEIDLQRLANDIENMYRMQGYEVQQIGNKDQMMVQLKKGGDLVMLIGLQAALSVILQHTPGGTIAMIGQQKWLDKAAVGAVGLVAAPVLWPLMITAGAGAIRQASLGNQVLNVVDGMIRQQYPRVQVGPVPVQIMPQLQQQWAPPSSVPVFVPSVPQYVPSTAKGTLRCPDCNTPYEEGDTFCSGCGRSLAPKKTLCPNCKAEIKPGLAFCPSCGASTFQAQPPTQQAIPPVPTPTYNAAQTTTCAKTTSATTETIRATHAKTTTCDAKAHGDICAWHSETRHNQCAKAATQATNTSLYATNSAPYNPDGCIAIVTDHACQKANHSQTSEPASHVACNSLGQIDFHWWQRGTA